MSQNGEINVIDSFLNLGVCVNLLMEVSCSVTDVFESISCDVLEMFVCLLVKHFS